MLRHYLAVAWRNAVRDRLYTTINIAGLALGLASAILIALFVRDELGYDRFLAGHERVYRVATDIVIPGHPVWHNPGVTHHTAAALALDFPELEGLARLDVDHVGLRHDAVEALEDIEWVDPPFLAVLGLPMVAGDAATALDAPDSVVLTRSMARKYFGTDTPLGAVLEIDRQHPMRVTAVIEDLPSSSHLALGVLASGRAVFSPLAEEDNEALPTGGNNFVGKLYARLKPGADLQQLAVRFPAFVHTHFPWDDGTNPRNTSIALTLDPVTSIHLMPDGGMTDGGSPEAILAVSIVGLVVVGIASINFINLMTARSARRALEVGVRKALGATRRQLMLQFLGESVAFATVAATLAASFIELALPWFNAFLGRRIDVSYWQDPGLAAGMIGLVLAVGVGAGFYPAFVLAALRPIAVLRGGRAGTSGGRLRQALVVLQFAASIGLAVATLVIMRQTDFATGQALRFDADQTLLVQGIPACSDVFRNRVAALPGVRGFACSKSAPVGFGSDGPITLADQRQVDTDFFPVDFGFFELYGLKPLAGRLFEKARSGDQQSSNAADFAPPLVINEAAARAYGFADPAASIGGQVSISGAAGPSEIIGVVPDFVIGSVRHRVDPAAFAIDPTSWALASIKLDGGSVPEDLKAIDRIWNETVNDRPIRRFFLDDRIEARYRDITKQSEIFAVSAGLALLIGCLGLFGLSAFTAERRTKEIGIRKALGASTTDVSLLLIWQFVKPVLIANAIAWPLTYLIMRRWLDGFAYRIPLSIEPFLIAGAAALAIAVITTAFHALQVARSRPVLALRYE